MNRRELVLALAERTDTDRKTSDAFLQAFVDTVTETVAGGEPVAISGFAKFARVDRKARMGRNPQTGEPIRIKASRRARITALKAFKDAVISGKVPRRPAAKKATATKAAAKRSTARKTTARKPAARKPAARRPAVKRTVKKATRRR